MVMTLLGHTPNLSGDDATSQDNPTHPYPWYDFLSAVGERLDVHFTFETATPYPESVNPSHVNFWHEAHQEYADADAFFAAIRESEKLRAFQFTRNERRPNIIHVIDRRLIGLEGYALNRKVDFEFAGTLGDRLVAALNQKVDHLKTWSGGDWRDVMDDGWTHIAVSVENQEVRRLLTDAVPLECYMPLLWRATTDLTQDPPGTIVQYAGLEGFTEAHPGQYSWPWWEWLRNYGGRAGCSFTIETMYRTVDDPAACPVFFGKEEEFESVDALLAELEQRIPWLKAVKNENRPEIIHLIDRELLQFKDYPLDRRLDVDYEGVPDGLVEIVAERIAAVKLADKESMLSNPITRIAVRSKGGRLRGILTDAMPLNTGSGVLWHARTWNRQDDPITRIGYPWPKSFTKAEYTDYLRRKGKTELEIEEFLRRHESGLNFRMEVD